MINLHYPEDIDFNFATPLLQKIPTHPMGAWFDLPTKYDPAELERIKTAALEIQQNSQYLVCIGIGGSYLGHRALIEALQPQSATKILYAGNSLDSFSLQTVLNTIQDADFSLNVISKSGTTTEPAVAFRILKQKLFEKYGAEAACQRIYATTDAQKGALHEEATAKRYPSFQIPDAVGGRYSVLSAVGLLPLAVAGVDINAFLAGAQAQKTAIAAGDSAVLRYAALRQQLYRAGYDTEVLATFCPRLQYLQEWWKQLFGESEGKQQRGVFPASVIYTTDLHSLGQYMQEGRRKLFETVVKITTENDAAQPQLTVPTVTENLDGLQYLEGKSLDFINQQALQATIEAHRAGGLPVLELTLPELSARSLGAFIYFFEVACAISAFIQGVDPFDQPGVEAYKKAMFHRLGKPGY